MALRPLIARGIEGPGRREADEPIAPGARQAQPLGEAGRTLGVECGEPRKPAQRVRFRLHRDQPFEAIEPGCPAGQGFGQNRPEHSVFGHQAQ